MKVQSPISWLGGKSALASRIVSLFPDHKHYVEIFAGALHVFFKKYPSELETVNDLNGDLVNFWLACRDHTEELIEKIAWTPYSRGLFLRWKAEPRPDDDIEWAARWFFLQCARVNGVFHGGWGCCKGGGVLAGTPPALRMRIRTERLIPVRYRLANVQIECSDYQVMIQRYGGSQENLLYLDPPYPGSEREYEAEFKKQDHAIMAKLLNMCKAKVFISYQENKMIRRLYSGSKWSITEFEVVRKCVMSKPGEKKPKATELLIANCQLQPTLFD